MIRRIILFTLLGGSVLCTAAQTGTGGGMGSGRGGGRMAQANGRFYGKIVDATTNKGIEAASIVLYGNRFDSATKKMKEAVLKTVITAGNGDFSLEGLPVFGTFKMKVTAVGYKALDKTLKFDLKRPEGGAEGGDASDAMTRIAGMTDVDLGNIKLEAGADDLGNVTVTTSSKQLFEMGVDRKIFNVDKNIVSTGQTATEIMKNIPSLNVDIDGNVTLRNAEPQLFVDGRPTTLTLDQIPADIIDKVELITNPSAKFDASGGNAGILNIVLKKNKKTGYNGNVRTGVDSRGRVNIGGDINLRQDKLNFFLSGTLNQRKSKSTTETNRNNFYNPPSYIHQYGKSVNDGYFGFLRGGFDYLIDNRNTLTVSGSYNKGQFKADNNQQVDSTVNGVYTSYDSILSNSKNVFTNFGSQISFKHNFAKNGHNISADANYNSSSSDNTAYLTNMTRLAGSGSLKYDPLLQQTIGEGTNKFVTLQADYENPITADQKLEAGLRSAIRNYQNNNNQYRYNYATGKYDIVSAASSRYKFNDQVHAAYATYSFKVKKWSYLLGLRVESSNYTGTLLGSSGKDSAKFKVDYPLSLFPSAFVTYKLSDKEDFQLNYSRRVNRPNFFQLMPFADYTDPQNISIGNAGLKPEFTNSFELSYNNAYTKGANFLATVFYKRSEDLITRYTYKDVNQLTGDSAYFYTYLNANSSYSYGLELTNKIGVTKWWDLTVNVNLFNSKINANIPGSEISNDLVSWFGKMNNSFKLPKGWSVQLSGDYQAKTVLPQNSGSGGGGGRRGGGGMFGGGTFGGVQPTAQGYILPRYAVDLAIRKDWTWKNGQSGSLTLSVNDLFRTQLYKTYSESQYFTQDTWRRRDPQLVRLNFSYRFGKFDVNLFKRKNNKASDSGAGDMGGMGTN
jgi:outer membrane receptor protein involved in Fe transport